MSAANMIKGREKRSTAGNRMAVLLAGQFQSEDAFMEVENDDEFIGKEEDDVFDEDFEETDEDEAMEDALVGEQALRDDERRAKQHVRVKNGRSALLPRIRLRLSTSPAKADGQSPTKKRRVALGHAVDAETGEVVTRNSMRQTTMKRSMQTQARLKEATKRRSSIVKRKKAVIAPKTQDTLIREALELEERNTASLRQFLAREEEKKKQARVVKLRVEAPLLRWVSRVEDVPIHQPPRIQFIEASSPLQEPSITRSVRDPSSTPDSSLLSTDPPAATLFSQPPATSLFLDGLTTPSGTSNGNELLVGTSRTPGDPPLIQPSIPVTERRARNYVILDLGKGATRIAQMKALFGNHTEWSWAEAAHREQDKQNIAALKSSPCAITGLPVKYLDPKTGVPYANVRAYKALRKLLRHEYVWSQGMDFYANDTLDMGSKGVPAEWSTVNVKGG